MANYNGYNMDCSWNRAKTAAKVEKQKRELLSSFIESRSKLYCEIYELFMPYKNDYALVVADIKEYIDSLDNARYDLFIGLQTDVIAEKIGTKFVQYPDTKKYWLV